MGCGPPSRCACVERFSPSVEHDETTEPVDEFRLSDAGDLFGEPEVLGDVEVARHCASRSRSSLSRSISLLARLVKSLSARTRSISAFASGFD